ncbi:hypothetical protein PAXRUDRAFT_151479 [Paxillus rubicundulus Ve08.2h10]|uniref:Uncharacterized protein n=1 Tax=Paxillus rubicundulus Ve08.2h10 TaxID=930991 RepID=A0A0D0DWT1_9AGAM|nr:hypothetical protein PAXRUDRAFT_151479 [Paxillus rubicundulus Ve08.2h10]
MYPSSTPANPQVPKPKRKTAPLVLTGTKQVAPSPRTSTTKNQPARSNRATDPSQDAGPSSSEAVYWEPYPYLTDCLLSWVLECSADCAILFYDKASGESSTPTDARASGQHKKDIYPVTAKVLFEKDLIYGSTYASQLEKLKTKYCAQCGWFKATGAGIKPGEPAYQNLMGSTLKVFLHFKDCDAMWHGIPSYNTKPFDSSPSTD